MKTENHNKQLLRREIGQLRDALSEEERQRSNQAIARNFFALPEYRPGITVFSYVGYRSEVDTRRIIYGVIEDGGTVCIPLPVPEKSSMKAVKVTDLVTDLVPGFKGIPEPHPSLADKGSIDPGMIDMVLVPGLVFDSDGGRLGYGGGFYDRFLDKRAQKALRVGLAYEIQVVAAVPTRDHDIPMDRLITENGSRRTGARERI